MMVFSDWFHLSGETSLLMKTACGINYVEASKSILRVNIQDTIIPFASPELLLRLKNTVRKKDKIDWLFLEQLLQHD